jgi:hypothetical protein
VLLNSPHHLDEREVRLAADSPAAIHRFHERAMRSRQVRLLRQTEIELALDLRQVEPAFGVRIECFAKCFHVVAFMRWRGVAWVFMRR